MVEHSILLYYLERRIIPLFLKSFTYLFIYLFIYLPHKFTNITKFTQDYPSTKECSEETQ